MSLPHALSAAVLSAAAFFHPSTACGGDAAEVNLRGQACAVKLYGAGGLGGIAPYQTGVLVSADGLIATVDSLVLERGEATAVLHDGSRRRAVLVGSDPIAGVALLRAQPPLVTSAHITFCKEHRVRAGQTAYVFANVFGIASGDEPVSMIAGVVCGRVTPGAGTADADGQFLLDSVTGAPGLPGGLVLAQDGTPLGMLSRVAVSDVTGLEVNPVVPSGAVATRVDAILSGVEVESVPRPLDHEPVSTLDAYGFAMIPDLTPRTPPYVDYVRSKSPAQKAGLLAGDLIVAVRDDVVSSQRDLLAALDPGVRSEPLGVQLTVKRDSELMQLVVDAEVGSL